MRVSVTVSKTKHMVAGREVCDSGNDLMMIV